MKQAIMVILLLLLSGVVAQGQFLDTATYDQMESMQQVSPPDPLAATDDPSASPDAAAQQAQQQQMMQQQALQQEAGLNPHDIGHGAQPPAGSPVPPPDQQVDQSSEALFEEPQDDWRAILMEVQAETQAAYAEAAVSGDGAQGQAAAPAVDSAGQEQPQEQTTTQTEQDPLASTDQVEVESFTDVFIGDNPTDIGQDSGESSPVVEEWMPAQSTNSRIQGKSSIGKKSGIQGKSGIKKRGESE